MLQPFMGQFFSKPNTFLHIPKKQIKLNRYGYYPVFLLSCSSQNRNIKTVKDVHYSPQFTQQTHLMIWKWVQKGQATKLPEIPYGGGEILYTSKGLDPTNYFATSTQFYLQIPGHCSRKGGTSTGTQFGSCKLIWENRVHCKGIKGGGIIGKRGHEGGAQNRDCTLGTQSPHFPLQLL